MRLEFLSSANPTTGLPGYHREPDRSAHRASPYLLRSLLSTFIDALMGAEAAVTPNLCADPTSAVISRPLMTADQASTSRAMD
jgi:hypothetical protein